MERVLLIMGSTLLLLSAITSLFAGGIFEYKRYYSTFGGLYYESYEELEVEDVGIRYVPLGIEEQGTDPEQPVIMSSTGPRASTEVSASHWAVVVKISCISSKTPENQIFKVTLYRLDPENPEKELESLGDLYIKSDSNPDRPHDEYVYCIWDIGDEPEQRNAYQLVIVRVEVSLGG